MIKICIDAGHYAKSNQSPAVKAYYESSMTWKLSNLQKKYLEEYEGVQVIMSREKQNVDKTLHSRGTASKGCNLFISNHSDAVGSRVDDKVDYVSVYCLTNDTTTDVDDRSKKIAEVIAPVIADVMDVKQGYKILTRKSSNDRNGDGIKNDNYYGVLNGARIAGTPGLLLEHSFHTNTRIANWLLDDANLERLAKAEAAALAKYFGLKRKDEPKPEPKHLYRIRKSWADVKSQVGAYSVLDNAKKNCPKGYAVYDENGKEVYSNKEISKPSNKVDAAASFDNKLTGTYKIRANGGLNLRTGASNLKSSVELMPDGSTCTCYGYYTKDFLFVASKTGKTGFANKKYLTKVK